MDAASDYGELEVPLPRSLSINQRLEHLSAMVHIPAVISKRLVVDNHLPGSLTDIHLSLCALPLSITEVPIGHLRAALLNLIERILGFLQREEFELHFGVDGAISDVVLVDSLPVLVEDAEVVEVGVPVEVHRHLVEG